MMHEMSFHASTYILRCPFLVTHDNTFDYFDAGETTPLALRLQLLEHQLVELLVVNQLRQVVTRNAILVRQALQVALIGHNDSNRLGLVLRGVNANVAYDRSRSVD